MKMIGLILDETKVERLDGLSKDRAVSSMPIAGCYRAIDFAISNMANAGVKTVGVISQYSSTSLVSHLTTEKIWNFGTKTGGIFVFTPAMKNGNIMWQRGTADAMYQNIEFLKRSQEPYVIIAAGSGIMKIDYKKMLKYHEEKNADITILTKHIPDETQCSLLGNMELDENNKVIEFEEKPLEPKTDIASLGVYIVNRPLLISLLEEVIKDGRYDFVTDVIARYRKRLNIYAYFHEGYWSNIGGVKKYFDTNMDFLKREVREELIISEPYISTKIKDDAPTKLNRDAKVTNSILGGGNIVNGCVANSVLFNKAYIGDKTKVDHSIVMNDSFIGNDCTVEYAIIDKNVVISDGKKVIGTPENIKIIHKGTKI